MTTDSMAMMNLRKAAGKLLASQPFYGSMVVRMPVEETEDKIETIGCDGDTIYANSTWTANADIYDVQVGLAHVVTACALKHHVRRGYRNYNIWQQASQMVTSSILFNSGVTFNKKMAHSLHSGLEGDTSVEEMYDKLHDEIKGEQEQQKQQEQNNGNNEADSQGSQSQGNQDQSSDQKQDSSQAQKGGQKSGGSSVAESVEQVMANYSEELPKNSKDGPLGEVMDAPKGEENKQEHKWNVNVRIAQRLNDMRGDEVSRAVKEKLIEGKAPPINWQELLREYMFKIAKNDYTWTNPNRRYAWKGIYLPGMRSNEMGTVSIVIDTSGSISKEELQVFWNGIRNIMEELLPEKLIVYACDNQIHEVNEYDSGDLPDTLEVSGHGGTDFAPAFKEIDRRGDNPQVILYWTDLNVHSAGFGQEPDAPVLWLKTPTKGDMQPPPFGTVIPLEKGDR